VAQRSALQSDWPARENLAHVQADLADPDVHGAIVQCAVDSFGGIDVLVNNSGMMFEKSVEAMTVEDWDRMMAVNLRAPLFMARQALPGMKKRGGGSIINIGSVEGNAANPGHTAYCASKAGVNGLTRAMAVDLGEYGIRCNAIAPGWIESDLNDAYLRDQDDPRAAREALHEMHPLGRVGVPRDIGDLAVYLAGDNAGFLTGQVLVVDGGRTSKLPLPAALSR
jgi:meso-butanediol dehydrogenase/(S,S)-butanediol dehydrogenase/diacetyl reductase